MFDERQETHRTLLAELTSRRRDSVFAPVPVDSGLMHRSGMSWAAQVNAVARDAYWSATDRIVATMDLTVGPAERTVEYAAPAQTQQRWSAPAPTAAAPPSHSEPRVREERAVALGNRGGWGRTLVPFALGFAAALLALVLAVGPLRTRLAAPATPAYAVPTTTAPSAHPSVESGATPAPKPAAASAPSGARAKATGPASAKPQGGTTQ
jgi:hypothetical protein